MIFQNSELVESKRKKLTEKLANPFSKNNS